MSLIQPDTSYNIIENTISQNAIKYVDSLDNSAVDKIISIASTGLSLKRDILTTAVETIITPLDITDVNTGNIITMARLCYLPIGLGALTIPTDGTTCNFNDAIQLQDYNNTPSPPLTHSEVKIGSNPSTLFGMNINTNTGTPFTITGDTGLTANITDDISLTSVTKSITLTAEDNISLVSSALGDINLDAPNIDSFGYAMPICFEVRESGTINYGGGQTLTNAFITNVNIPPQFIVDSPVSGYTSNIWRIGFTIQTWNAGGQNNSTDKALAYYIDFNDQSSTIYTPFLFDANTPYCKHNNNSTWTGSGSLSEFQSHTWTDYIDFSGLATTGSGNLPLKLNLFIATDNPKDFTFKFVCSLTRTNLLP